ncbi:type I restriction enzyme S subunit [Sinobaca qinghaiensis]|uniref:Type I restriction enzyme S subunit n=1 Tax=Sinobaca qinghaiensis TaxID=342944 RepID=A0A419V5N2_9BACL|nr:restriction endonuclease subunit S [Sinobaca qinghaiensis]RKD75259.1 type I restriction enzyme S subunit [Sinobaca qinghaiensis]
MSEWRKVQLGEVLKITSGKSKPLKNLQPYSKKNPYPVYGGNGINGYTNEFLIEKEAIVIGRVGEYCGVVHKTKGPSWVTDNALFSKEFIIKTDLKFISYLLKYHDLGKLRSQSGQPLVSQKPIYNYEINLPLLNEQKKIAAILTSVDNAIEKTEAIIKQAEKVKKGLMQQLLTKGIGHTKFKQTEIGEIPKEWEFVKLGDITTLTMGQSPKGDSYNNIGVGIPLLNGPTEFGKVNPKVIQWTNKPTKICKESDILLTVRGSSTGRMNVADKEYCIGRGLAAITALRGITDQNFIMYHIQKLATTILSQSTGSTFPNIDKQRLSNLFIPLPKLKEQIKIANILYTADNKIKIEGNKLLQLQNLKKSLMQVLLTGKVRVKVNELEAVK